MNLQATVCAALANLCAWVHYGDDVKINSGHYQNKVAAIGAWSCGQVWDYVPGRLRDSEPVAAKQSKAYMFFSGVNASKNFLRSIDQAIGTHLDLEIKQIPAGLLWVICVGQLQDIASRATVICGSCGLTCKTLSNILSKADVATDCVKNNFTIFNDLNNSRVFKHFKR